LGLGNLAINGNSVNETPKGTSVSHFALNNVGLLIDLISYTFPNNGFLTQIQDGGRRHVEFNQK